MGIVAQARFKNPELAANFFVRSIGLLYDKSGFVSFTALQALSYGIAPWAMTLVPIAIVASLRETSVRFGAVIAVIVLKEPSRTDRAAARFPSDINQSSGKNLPERSQDRRQ